MRLKDLSERPYGHYATSLIDAAKNARQEAINEDPTVLRGDFHAAAVLSGNGDIYVETTLWLGAAGKIPAVLRAISEMAKAGDRDVLLIAVYGGEPGAAPSLHAPCKDCMRKILAYDVDHSCDIAVEAHGKLKLASLSDLLDA